jgi:hypothetical protein
LLGCSTPERKEVSREPDNLLDIWRFPDPEAR